MSVTSILRDTPNNVSLVRMIVSDTLATVVSANYIANQMANIRALNTGSWQWYVTDMLMVSASDGNALFNFTDSTFSSLTEYSGTAAGVVSPGLINQIAWYAANGTTVSGLPTANNGVLFTSNTGVPSIGTAPVVAGGTGKTSVTTAPTASSWAGWDANKNLSANNFIAGYATTATAGATTTLTVASAYLQYFTGTLTQTVVLPVTSTLVLGQSFFVENNSSGALTVNSSGGNLVQTMAADTNAIFTCILTSGTTAASWNVDYFVDSALVLPLSMANGGTNANLTAANGAIPYSTATAFALLAAGTSGQLFQSGGVGAPNWTTATYPATAGTAGNLLTSDGTNWVSSAPAKPTKVIVAPLTGDTVTLVSTNNVTILNPAGTLATLTVDMPAAPVDGQEQTVSTTQIITALTVTGGGHSIVGTQTALAVGQAFTMIYNLGDTTWYPA